ncbi:type II toxin-antitoxin system VapC family toxin [Rhizobium sp. LjRoot254]|uniref:type II toxin-antitoxin system VapC family toxin n=1 Tax=Rhizobium sp. LjRoot254 TaxID=3342297 RepID=UPI003ED08D89
MKFYFDTSIFVPLTVLELKTKAVQQWFSECEPMEIVISDWTIVEFHSALALKLRTGQIDAGLRAGAQELFARYTSESFQIIEVTRADFGRAATLANKEALKLRAGDALHLAIAERQEFQVCTLDKHLFEAAFAVGVPAFTI